MKWINKPVHPSLVLSLARAKDALQAHHFQIAFDNTALKKGPKIVLMVEFCLQFAITEYDKTFLLGDVVVRRGLPALLDAEGDIAVVGEAENGREAVVLAKKTLPDVVLMDLAVPGLNGLEATR